MLGKTTLPRVMASGKNVTLTADDHPNQLHIAAVKGHSKTVTSLLKMSKAFANAPCTSSQLTALHLATLEGHTDTVRALLKSGVSVDKRDTSGCSPLHMAMQKGNADIALLLLLAGATFEAKNNREQTPLELLPTDHTARALFEALQQAPHAPVEFYKATIEHAKQKKPFRQETAPLTGRQRQSPGGRVVRPTEVSQFVRGFPPPWKPVSPRPNPTVSPRTDPGRLGMVF